MIGSNLHQPFVGFVVDLAKGCQTWKPPAVGIPQAGTHFELAFYQFMSAVIPFGIARPMQNQYCAFSGASPLLRNYDHHGGALFDVSSYYLGDAHDHACGCHCFHVSAPCLPDPEAHNPKPNHLPKAQGLKLKLPISCTQSPPWTSNSKSVSCRHQTLNAILPAPKPSELQDLESATPKP